VRGQLPPNFAIDIDEDEASAAEAATGGNSADPSKPVLNDSGAVEEYVPHTALDMEAAAKLEYRLVSEDVCHMCVENDMATVYHSAQNSTYYLNEEEGCVTFDLAVAPAMEFLIKSYPSWSGIAQLPVGGGDDEDRDDEEEDEDAALSLSLCAMLTELARVGILETRKIE